MSKQGDHFDMDLFTLETKLKKYINELVEPSIERTLQDRKSIQMIRKQLEGHDKRIHALEVSLFKSTEKLNIFEELHEKMASLVSLS